MDMSIASILQLMRFTVQDPRAAARQLMAQRVPDVARWLLFGLVVSASAVLTHLSFDLLPPVDTQFMASAMTSPMRTAFMQAGFLLLTVAGVYRIGRARGGIGSFSDALLLISWLQFILLCLQAVQIVALLILPPVAEILGIVGLVLSVWLLTQFTAALHGFQSGWRVFIGILAVVFSAAILISFLVVAIYGTGV